MDVFYTAKGLLPASLVIRVLLQMGRSVRAGASVASKRSQVSELWRPASGAYCWTAPGRKSWRQPAETQTLLRAGWCSKRQAAATRWRATWLRKWLGTWAWVSPTLL